MCKINDFKEMQEQLFNKINNKMLVAKHINYGLKNPAERFFEEELFIVTYDGKLYYCVSYTNGDFTFPTMHKLLPEQMKSLINLINAGLKWNESKFVCCDGAIWDITTYNKSKIQTSKFKGYIYGIERLEKICAYLNSLITAKSALDRYIIKQTAPRGNFTTFICIDKLTGKKVCMHQQPKNTQGINISETINVLKMLSKRSSSFLSVYDTFEDRQNNYFVIEHIEGTYLRQIVSEQNLHWKTAIEIVKELAMAAEIAHVNGFLLLNIDPTNIIIDKNSKVRLLTNIGSRINEIYVSFPKDVLFQPGYSAPEIYTKKALGPYTDVYMLAATLYTIVTGKQPVNALYRYRGEPLKSVLKHAPSAPPKLERIIHTAMDLSISKRTKSARELYDQLNTL